MLKAISLLRRPHLTIRVSDVIVLRSPNFTLISSKGRDTATAPSPGKETTGVTSNSALPPSGLNTIASGPDQSPSRFHQPNTRPSSQQRHSSSTSPLHRATSPRNKVGHSTRQRPSTSSIHRMSPHSNSTRPSNSQPPLSLGIIGSSDYGSQDTSNLSVSPMPQQSAISPQFRLPAHER